MADDALKSAVEAKDYKVLRKRQRGLILKSSYFGMTVSEFLEEEPHTAKMPTQKDERQNKLASNITRFLLTLPKDRLRGILLALNAPEELLSALDQQESLQ